MKRKNRGAISIFALLSMMFFLVFIMVAYSNVVQKGKMQSETEAILIDYYKSFQTIDEAYTSIHKDEVRTAGRDLVNLLATTDGHVYIRGNIYNVNTAIQPISFIENVDKACIDTGYLPKQNTKIEFIAEPTNVSSSSDYQVWYGGRDGALNNTYTLWNHNTDFRTDYANKPPDDCQIPITMGLSNFRKYTILQNGKSFKVNGAEKANHSYNSTFQSNSSLALFSVKTSGIMDERMAHLQLFSCKIWTGSTLEREYIPCYITENTDIDGVSYAANTVGLYDKVERKFYSNQGSSNFIGYQELEYIESTNGRWTVYKYRIKS